MNDSVISISGVVKTYPGFNLTLPELNLKRGHLHVLLGPRTASSAPVKSPVLTPRK